MRYFKFAYILLIFASCKGQGNLKEYKFSQVGWTLKIPADSKFLDSAQFDTISQKAINAINKTYNTQVDFSGLKSLFIIRQGQYNVMGSTINLYDSALFKTWQESYSATKKMLMKIIEDQAPGVTVIDTESSFEIIDGLRFEKVFLKTFYPEQNLTMNIYWFYRKQNEYDFSINISYTEEKIGKQYLGIIKNSKFNK